MRLLALTVALAAPQSLAVAPDWQEGVQAALLLSAILPQHGRGPSKEVAAKMEEAGSILYKGYVLLQSAASNLEEARQQLASKARMEAAAANLATGEELLQRGAAARRQGQGLQNEAEASLQSLADPLGPPPEAPKSWSSVEAIGRRAASKERALRSAVVDLRREVKRAGVSLIDVASEKVHVEVDPVAEQEDKKLLDFLSKY